MKNLLLIQPRSFLRKLYPSAVWKIKTSEKVIYLTFDDGPVPLITDWVLETLKSHSAKATFFCVGSNVQKYPSVYSKIKSEGHLVANHSMTHMKGFKNTVKDYLDDVAEGEKVTGSKTFRPPYGQLKRSQYKALRQKGYRIVLWDVISYDYENIHPERCAEKVIQNAREGSVVLFHDSVKAEKNLRYALPIILKHFANLQYQFRALDL